ncbi:DUF5990 family protein [Sphingobium sp. SA916]|uniref:DUF5990 family protein n=1 Tax=Sphingobium sp. SA916 TaxID=1851207 RepID=UPI00209BE49D|nr:DUF5990 family protein [Sphingobium sp. SA916]
MAIAGAWFVQRKSKFPCASSWSLFPGSLQLQSKDGQPLDARLSEAGEALAFDFSGRVGAGPKFFGEQVRREGPERRFVYIRVGNLAG